MPAKQWRQAGAGKALQSTCTGLYISHRLLMGLVLVCCSLQVFVGFNGAIKDGIHRAKARLNRSN